MRLVSGKRERAKGERKRKLGEVGRERERAREEEDSSKRAAVVRCDCFPSFSTGSASALENPPAPLCSTRPARTIRAGKRGARDTKKSEESKREKEKKGGGKKPIEVAEKKKKNLFSSRSHLLVASALLGDVALRALGLEDLLAAGEVCAFLEC